MRARKSWALLAALCLAAPAAAEQVTANRNARFAQAASQIDAAKTAMMSDPANALARADRALTLARALPASPRADLAVATADWLEGWAYISLKRSGEAIPLIDDGLRIADRIGPNTKLQGDLKRSRGLIAATAGRMQEALTYYQQAYSAFTAAHEARSQAIILSDIGQLYEGAGDYPRALRFYAQSAAAYRSDHALLLASFNNRGILLQKLKREAEAEAQFRSALHEARLLRSALFETQVQISLALAEAQRGELAAAQSAVDRAAHLVRLPESASLRPFVFGAAARVAERRDDLDRAGALLSRMFSGVDLTQTDASYEDFHLAASRVYERLDRADLALAHLQAYQRLHDSARDLTASYGAQLMAARFDFASQNLRIARLQAGQLERDIRIEQEHSLLLKGALGAGAVLLTLLLIGYWSLRRSRNEVREANVALTTVNARLEKALAAKAEFLATTSHEIRTPLNGILGMTQVLLSQAGLDPDVREKVEIAHGAGETMRALVSDILDIAKMETGQVSVTHAPARARQLLLDAARLWRGHAETKGLYLTLDTGDVPSAVVSDEGRLRQIVSNLLSNAVKFTETGGIALTASTERAADGSEQLRIAVTDTGVGIPPEHQALVFEPFHQVDGSVTRQFAGTGLGLAICHRLAQALGGTLDLQSEPGVGSTFLLRMPLEHVAAAGPAAAIARPDSLAQAHVLLVEANPLTQGLLRALLEGHVSSIQAVADGDAALAVIASGWVHHLVLDADSVHLAGLEVTKSIGTLTAAADEAGAVTTLLATTDGVLSESDFAATGASQSVIKPVAGAALLAAMRRLYPATPMALAA